MLLYLLSAFDQLLMAKAVGLRMVLSGALLQGHFILSLICSSQASNPTPDASVLGTIVWFTTEPHAHILFFMTFALSNNY